MRIFQTFLLTCLSFFFFNDGQSQDAAKHFTHQDSLRGTITPERAWWDALKYDILVIPDYRTKTIKGSNIITYKTLQNEHPQKAQIDLQDPLLIDSIFAGDTKTTYLKEGNAYLVDVPKSKLNSSNTLKIYFHGTPKEAVNPPWDGGWVWKKDKRGNPWMSVACQGLGASVWYPCKDHQSDEPDSASLSITAPPGLTAIGNGRLKSVTNNNDSTRTYKWVVTNPINNYNIIPYIGKYVNWNETLNGEKGKLDCSYWVLNYNLDAGKKQFAQVPLMIKCFEYWFGPYPFYEDSYKLVESPYLGMEHQSSIAYGNMFINGYLGKDLSGSGWGLKWDYIIVHESGHEWFGNNITAKDVADMWIHESFTTYSETIFTGCQWGAKAANEYASGARNLIQNDAPIIGQYEVNQEGSVDMYRKGSSMIHNIRTIINNDEKFRAILRGMNKVFYHQTVTSRQIEDYISKCSGIDFSKVFDQYLRDTHIPVFEYKISGSTVTYRWANCVKGFNMPLKINFKGERWLKPTEEWQSLHARSTSSSNELNVDNNFYVRSRKVN